MWLNDRVTPTANYRFWAEHFQARGHVALLVDSFGSRGEREICTHKVRRITPERERSQDAYAALRWLATRSDVEAGRIHLMGWSNGATAVLEVLRPDAAGRPADKAPAFRAAVAMYPGCARLATSAYAPTAPLLIQSGSADDWTPAERCRVLARSKSGAAIEIDVYEGAHHGFDNPSGVVRTRPEVRNPSSPTGWGATVGGNPEARRKAIERVTAFIEAH
jgi:dienelactone hydrolase